MSVLNTSVSGMLANSNWLSTIAQNVANANTTGYKNTETQFSALVDASPGQTSQVAGVTTSMVSYNTLQGQVETTQTVTDLAVQGAGFFVVSDGSGDIFLTRNGSFIAGLAGQSRQFRRLLSDGRANLRRRAPRPNRSTRSRASPRLTSTARRPRRRRRPPPR